MISEPTPPIQGEPHPGLFLATAAKHSTKKAGNLHLGSGSSGSRSRQRPRDVCSHPVLPNQGGVGQTVQVMSQRCVLSDGYPSPLLTVYTSLVAERNGTLVPTARQDIAPGQEETEQRQIEQQRQESKRVAMERLDSPGSLDVSLFSGGASSFLLATASLFQMRDRKSTRLNSSHTLASRMPSSA